jgi:DMSO/TMAO reductase YedYZ molybdopterin-dependent catalytic subunit
MMPSANQRVARPLVAVVALLFFSATTVGRGQSSAVSAAPQLIVGGDVAKPLSLSLDDLRHMSRATVKAKNEHAEEEETYEGVPLAALLTQAGAPQGAQLRGKAMATYVVIEGADGYQVIFSIAELDFDFENSEVLVADTLAGKPLNDKLGPLRLVAPHDKRPARWVRMLHSIKVVSIAKQPSLEFPLIFPRSY